VNSNRRRSALTCTVDILCCKLSVCKTLSPSSSTIRKSLMRTSHSGRIAPEASFYRAADDRGEVDS
jgi:hypothetical protein